MRQVGELENQRLAERFRAYLWSRGIDSELRSGERGEEVEVWVVEEDDLARARTELAAFGEDPEAARFAVPRTEAARPEPEPQVRRPARAVRREGNQSVTLAIILLSVAATLAASTPQLEPYAGKLYFSEYYGGFFPEIRRGEIWRLITPVFLHGGILHLVFNMLWVYQLASQVETNEGSRFLVIFGLVFAALVNTAQYLVSGPRFVGMSGVVYALLGYIWMMARFKPGSGYFLPRETVGFMVVWLIICLTPLIANVANTQHVVGLAAGVAFGYLRSGRLKTRRRQAKFRDQFRE